MMEACRRFRGVPLRFSLSLLLVVSLTPPYGILLSIAASDAFEERVDLYVGLPRARPGECAFEIRFFFFYARKTLRVVTCWRYYASSR